MRNRTYTSTCVMIFYHCRPLLCVVVVVEWQYHTSRYVDKKKKITFSSKGYKTTLIMFTGYYYLWSVRRNTWSVKSDGPDEESRIKIYRMTRISNVCRVFNCWGNVMIYIPDISNEFINYKNRESIIFT